MIGEISRIEGSRVAVRPAVDWHAVDFVAVLRQAPLPPPASERDALPFEWREPSPALSDLGEGALSFDLAPEPAGGG